MIFVFMVSFCFYQMQKYKSQGWAVKVQKSMQKITWIADKSRKHWLPKQKKQESMSYWEFPVILLMLCVLYLETESLPRTKTDIVWDIIQMYKERAEGKGCIVTDEMLLILGLLSLEASQRDTHQLLIKQVSVWLKLSLYESFQW